MGDVLVVKIKYVFSVHFSGKRSPCLNFRISSASWTGKRKTILSKYERSMSSMRNVLEMQWLTLIR